MVKGIRTERGPSVAKIECIVGLAEFGYPSLRPIVMALDEADPKIAK